jgi:diaminopimelate epimerase
MSFSRWHALGNTYLLAERSELGDALTPERVRVLCDGRADGLLEVLSAEDGAAEIVIWNPDGSTAELSGNGTRIAARWLAERTGAREVTIRVGEREVHARMLGGADVEMSLGTVEVGEIETLDLGSELVEITPVSVGNPHAVVRREPERGELLRIGPLIENHARFPERTNVQLIRVDGLHDLTVAVWERGAGETRTSGTSAVAAAAAAVANGWSESPITVHMPGGDLRVTLDAENRATLVGPAERSDPGAA